MHRNMGWFLSVGWGLWQVGQASGGLFVLACARFPSWCVLLGIADFCGQHSAQDRIDQLGGRYVRLVGGQFDSEANVFLGVDDKSDGALS